MNVKLINGKKLLNPIPGEGVLLTPTQGRIGKIT